MKKEFITDPEKDPTLTRIYFTDDNKSDFFYMEISCTAGNDSTKLIRDIWGSKKLLELGGPNQNFSINFKDKSNVVKITGNLSNVLNIFKTYHLISDDLLKHILSDTDMVSFLQNSNQEKIYENKIAKNKSNSAFFKSPVVEPLIEDEEILHQDIESTKKELREILTNKFSEWRTRFCISSEDENIIKEEMTEMVKEINVVLPKIMATPTNK